MLEIKYIKLLIKKVNLTYLNHQFRTFNFNIFITTTIVMFNVSNLIYNDLKTN